MNGTSEGAKNLPPPPDAAWLSAMENYSDLKRIGRGSYGTVFLARDGRDGRDYCLKQIGLEAYAKITTLRARIWPGSLKYCFVHIMQLTSTELTL